MRRFGLEASNRFKEQLFVYDLKSIALCLVVKVHFSTRAETACMNKINIFNLEIENISDCSIFGSTTSIAIAIKKQGNFQYRVVFVIIL